MDYEERRQFQMHAVMIQKMAAQLDALLAERQRERNPEAMDKLRQIVTDLYGQHTAYTNLVIVAGYGACFAVWQYIENFISLKARFWSALLLLVSLVLFIGYEVHKMVLDTWRMRHLTQALLRLPEARRLEALQAILLRGQLNSALTWAFVVIPTVAAGLAGGGILIGVVAAKLFGYTFLP